MFGAKWAGAGEEVAFLELGLAGWGWVRGVNIGDCEFCVGGDGGERAEGEGGMGVGDCCVCGAGVVEEGDLGAEGEAEGIEVGGCEG